MEQEDIGPHKLLQRLWNHQALYNRKIKEKSSEFKGDNFWNKQYLLGLVSEVDEVLRELDWKEHRAEAPFKVERNLALELADLTKYVLSLWQHNGFSLFDTLKFSLEKTRMLEAQFKMDFDPIPPGCPIIISDIDGTLGDYRSALATYLEVNYQLKLPADDAQTLQFDSDMGLAYPVYHPLKEEFEEVGGYGRLPIYEDAFILLKSLNQWAKDLAIIVYTARPTSRYKHIWLDTYEWLEENGITPTQLHIGNEERVLLAAQLVKEGHNVIMLEDNPDIIRRASSTGLLVAGRLHPYNEDCKGLPGVKMYETYQISYVSYDIKNVLSKGEWGEKHTHV